MSNTKNMDNTNNKDNVSFYDRYYDVYLVNAPTLIIFKGIIKNLAFLSFKKKEQYGGIVEWSKQTLDSKVLSDIRSQIFDIFKDAFYDTHGKSKLMFRDEERNTYNWYTIKDDQEINIFMTRKFWVSREEYDSDNRYIVDCNVSILLDILSLRIGKIIRQLELDSQDKDYDSTTEEYDNKLKDVFTEMQDKIDLLRERAEVFENEQKELYKKFLNRIAKSPRNNTPHIPHIPRTQQLKNEIQELKNEIIDLEVEIQDFKNNMKHTKNIAQIKNN